MATINHSAQECPTLGFPNGFESALEDHLPAPEL